ncbi:MAG: endolytic transglycosylase MltG [Oscillatoriales cyanobacterium C42_A2020_001]|nr:endolytic transglycosylase MltG [Leptolyngbyaceae cyanobacterium C42_A2020_001]
MAKQFPTKSFLGLLLAAFGIAAWQGWSWWAWASAPPLQNNHVTNQKPINLSIPPGTSAQEIGQDLEALGVIRSAQAWNLWSRWLMWQNSTGGFQAGTYQLSKAEPMQDVAAKIWKGDVAQSSFTIPEGWSIREMAQYFEQRGFFSAQAFIDATNQVSTAEYPWLPASAAVEGFPRLEGYLFPDTYQMPLGEGIQPEAVVRQMLDRFEQVALPIYQQQQGKTNLSLVEWVTLGSIVEKEAVIPTERSRISGVFHNRLKRQMPLASDPTVEYAFGIKQTPDRPLTYAQVAMPSPYNTYVNPGLPPAPIASPGKASLEATLNPEATEYLYFVARYDGTHVFSRTLADHQAAQNAIHDQREAAK